jgi:hypothetical protein
MKKTLPMLFVLLAFAAMCHATFITVTVPNGGEKLILKKYALVGWQHGGTIDESLVKLVLFKGGTDEGHKVGTIAQSIPIGYSLSATYNWQVGAYEGGFAVPGNDYYIKVITMDGNFSDFSDNPFSIVPPMIPIERLQGFVEFNPDPGCPMCGIFEIGALLAQLGNPSGVAGNLVLLRNGRQVGLLGRLGRGGLLPTARVRLKFPADDFAQIGRGGEGFEVAIIGDSGNILKRAPISLRMRR